MCGGAHPWFHSEKAQKGKGWKNVILGFVAFGAKPQSPPFWPRGHFGSRLVQLRGHFGSRPGAGQVLSQNGNGAKKGSQKAKKAKQRLESLEKDQNVKIIPKSQKQFRDNFEFF